MDPTATLAEIRVRVATLLDPEQVDSAEHAQQLGEEIAERFTALDDWLTRDGFLPDTWSNLVRK